MAELILAVKDIKVESSYRKGDIIEQFNNRRISAIWVDCLTKTHLTPFNLDGLRPVNSMAYKKQELIMQYKMQRISETEVLRTNLKTELAISKEDIISDKPNVKNEYIFLNLFLAKYLKNPRHKIFGIKGKEVWFGGHTDVTQPTLDLCWNMIETESVNRKTDFLLSPLGKKDIRCFLALNFNDFTDEQGAELVEAEYEPDLSVKDKPGFKIVQKRKNYINWDSETEISGETIVKINDNKVVVDLRDKPDNSLSLVRVR